MALMEMNREERLLDILLEGAQFFDSRESAREVCRTDAVLEYAPNDAERSFYLEYDFLFRGTDADFIPPLWASLEHEDRVLCNSTTLRVIQTYHKWGYGPKHIDGNPADYVGEQLHFLAYLTAGILKAMQQGTEPAALITAREEFLQEYTMDNVKDITLAVEKRGTFPEIITFLRELTSELALFPTGRTPALAGSAAKEKEQLLREGINAPIPDGEAYIVPTAGVNNCGGKCVIRPTVQDGCLLKIESDCSSNNPQIRACVRGRGYRRTFLSPERLRYPMKRLGKRGSGKFERISWPQAVRETATEWKRIRDAYGVCSRYVNYATGVTGIMRPTNMANNLLSLDGGYLGYFNSYSSACVEYVSEYIYGTPFFGTSPRELLNAKLVVIWGNNDAETIIGSERNYYLSQLKGLGVKIVVIDPRMSQTAVAYADEWIPIRPTTDSALADAIAYVLWQEGLQDQSFMDRCCLGFDEEHMPAGAPENASFKSYIFGLKDGVEKSPEWAEDICGVPAGKIRELARLMGTAKPATIVAGYGPQRNGNGEQTTRSICALCSMTGNIGIPGGNAGSIIMTKEHANPVAVVNGIANPYPGKIPSFLWTKAIEHGTELTPRGDRLKGVEKLDSNIKMMLNLAGNTLINQHSDINDTVRILQDESLCEFILCSDIVMTPSARFADILMPGASIFETENITPPWRGSNYLLRNNQVIDPLFESRAEWEWMKELAAELGYYEEFTRGHADLYEILECSYNELRTREKELPDYETFCREGGWQYREWVNYIAFEKEAADPVTHPFPTPSGKIEIFSQRLFDFQQEDIPAIPCYLPCPEGPSDPLREKYPLQLIGWHTRRRCHSTHDNNEWMDEVEKPGLWIHPEDALSRGIHNGAMVRIFNDRGTVEIPAIVTRRICRGVVAMSQGGWYTPDKSGVDKRGSINVLTGTAHPTPLAKGNPQHTNLVEVKLA